MTTELTRADIVPAEIATTGDGRDITEPWVMDLREYQDDVLRGAGNDLLAYEKVLGDDQVWSCWQQRRNAVVSCEWRVEAGGTGRVDRKAADFIRETLHRIGIDNVTLKMLSAVYYGYAVAECLWASDGGLITLNTIKVRNARRFRWDRWGRLRLLTNQDLTGEAMPNYKFWTLTAGADHDDAVYGRGLGHWLYWPVWFKRNFIQFWALWAEKYASPTVVGTMPQGASDGDQAKLLGALRALRRDSALVIKQGTVVELLEATKSSSGDYQALVRLMNEAIAKVVLSQTMTTDSGSSLSQAQVHLGVQRQVIKTDADLVCESANRQWIAWLTSWNFPGAAVPRLWRETEAPDDLKARADRDAVICTMGYRPTAAYVTATYGDGFEASVPGPAALPTPSPDPANFAAGEAPPHPIPFDGRLDRLAEALAVQADALFGQVIDRVRASLDAAPDWDTARAALVALDTGGLGTLYAPAFGLAYLLEFTGEAVPPPVDPVDFAAPLALPAPPLGEGVPFREAIDYFRGKVNIPTERWTDLWQSAHARGFMVAGAQSAALLADFRGAIDKAISQGTTLATFRKDFDRIVAEHGWSYKGSREWRSQVIYETNLRGASSAGRWAQIQAVRAVRPYIVYHHTPQERPRPAHLALNGKVRPADDVFWGLYWPPNGWHCKCWAEALAADDLPERGLTVSPPVDIEWAETAVGSGEQRRTILTPKGIDPGFAYNPGQAWEMAREVLHATPQQLGALATERGARQRVAEFAGRTGREYLEAVDRDTGYHLAAQAGDKSRVAVARQPLAAEALDPARRIAVIHSHPDGTPLSPRDYFQLSAPGVDTVEAISPTGVVFGARRGPAWPRQELAERMLEKIRLETRKGLAARIDGTALTPAMRADLAGRTLHRALAERGAISGTLPPPAVDLERFEGDISEVAAAIARLEFAAVPDDPVPLSVPDPLPRLFTTFDGCPVWGMPDEWAGYLATLDDVPPCQELAFVARQSQSDLADERARGTDEAELAPWAARLSRLQARLQAARQMATQQGDGGAAPVPAALP